MNRQVRTTIGIAAAAAVAAGAGVYAGVALSEPRPDALPGLSEPATSPLVANREVIRAAQLSEAFITIAQAVTSAVVRIEAERTLTHPADVWGTRPLRPFGEEAVDTTVWDALPDLTGGSGFIISQDGYILTNRHVVADADRLLVSLADKRVFTATMVGGDPATDLAVVRIAADGLPIARLGDSDSTRVGEWVLAIGNPGFGDEGTLDFTVTSGIISAKGRPLQLVSSVGVDDADALAYTIEDFLQTDAVINPGNSGGPLVNLGGLVIGVNTAIASSTGFSEGYGFAIPANLTRRVARDLIEHGYVRRPVLGVSIRDVTPEDAELYGLTRIAGALVEDFPSASPAAQAGLRRHDVITAVDGRPVERVGQLQRLVAQREPGESVRLSVTRFGDTLSLAVRLAQAPRPAETTSRDREAVTFTDLGLQFAELDAATARQLGFGRPGGIVIADVQPFSPADRKGVTPGDRVLTIGGERITTVTQALSLIRAAQPGRVVSILIETATGRTYIANIRVH
ncbi:MAG: trypsin-like peptidase domain-containing protein [Gemmatimonadetes bacterium]|nr:trypsin-like peptidase domain-containing protein [Gemmatimonadota bacterium]